MTWPGVEVFVGDDDQPAAVLSEALTRVLSRLGVFDVLNDRAGLLIGEGEAEQVPVARLDRFIAACQKAAVERVDGVGAVRFVDRGVKRQGHDLVPNDVEWSATEAELRGALDRLADVARQAKDAGQPIGIVMS